ncbi:hypothetical protein [Flavobacterium sp. DG2-3]|uniref:hypothetical protein n=1 Tax=Flavobacterium sp. DG2-3 TaxID=3068317 RepID=UPI00273EEBF5|nr:hypothetical protein [Flavobacterium sp. DG2-3]MDP5202024.1 hypothetical protein [Flavobacterium sp. DG2-3]
MKKIIFLITSIVFQSFIYSQTFDGNLGSNSLKWSTEQKDFNSTPRSNITPMSLKLWDNYGGLNAPSDYGSVLEIYGKYAHLVSQLYFNNNWQGGQIMYRSAFYNENTWGEWRTLLDSKSDVISSGNLKISGVNDNYILKSNLGIGTANPSNVQGWQRVLDVCGLDNSKIIATSSNSSNRVGVFSHTTWNGGGGFVGTETNHPLHFITNYSPRMTISNTGNVGIDIVNPKNKLDVNGTIHSKEVKVDLTGWSDFVFKKEYNLPTLEEVEKHIVEKGHLENIPNEEEVLKNGINLGEMNSKLLQKIEEMTLYMIEMKKDISALKCENEALRSLLVTK